MRSLDAPPLKHRSAALAMAAAITVLFNTVLTWAKEAYAPLKTAMIALTGHHWTTHSLLVLVVFVLLGAIFSRAHVAARTPTSRLIVLLVGAVVLAGAGLFAWFAGDYWL